MRALFAILLLTVALPSGCTTDAPEDGQDAAVDSGGATEDGSLGDGASATCEGISQRVQQILDQQTACKIDADCVIPITACGLPADCDTDGIYANKEWRTAEMDQLLGDWLLRMCGQKACICPRGPVREPGCNMGVCGPKGGTGQPVGAACTAGADCATGQCLTEKEDQRFVGGYCTLKNCDRADVACPRGSSCKAIGRTMQVCLQDCDAMITCRKGYGCCGPGPRLQGWCSPDDSPLCMLN